MYVCVQFCTIKIPTFHPDLVSQLLLHNRHVTVMNRMYNIPRALVMTLACYGVLEIVGVIIIIIIIIISWKLVRN